MISWLKEKPERSMFFIYKKFFTFWGSMAWSSILPNAPFGVSAGKFLGFMVSQRGIEVSLDQIKAVMETPPPKSKKELQRLTGKLVALGRFIARFIDELRPFFLAIRKAGADGWTDSCQNAFEKIKHCLMQPPILSSPIPNEKLYMYLAVSEWAVSAILFRCPSPKE